MSSSPPSLLRSLSNLGLGYSIAISLGLLVLLSTLLLASYICCRSSSRRTPSPPPNASLVLPRIIFVAEDDDDEEEEPRNVVSASGLDPIAIASYPKFQFSAAEQKGKGEGEGTCAICLCEYKEGEMLRMMPDCGHYFHLMCVDAWLRLNASCPVCRNSPMPTPVSTPLSTPLSELVPLSQFAGDRRRSVEPSIGLPAANLLVQAAEAALPNKRRTFASSEFKHVVVAQRRHVKVVEHEVYFPGYIHLPQDILLHVFRSLDMTSLVNASLVCWNWNTVAKENMLWMSQYSIIFGKFDSSITIKSHDCVDDDGSAVKIKDGKVLSVFDWREAFKRRFIDCSAWRSRPHRAVCLHCKSIIWLSGLTCDTPHCCPKSERGRIKIKPIPACKLVDYLLGRRRSACIFDGSDDSDSDGAPSPNWLPRLWALPSLID